MLLILAFYLPKDCYLRYNLNGGMMKWRIQIKNFNLPVLFRKTLIYTKRLKSQGYNETVSERRDDLFSRRVPPINFI